MHLIAATGLVILLKLDSTCQFFSPCNLEIWWMTSNKVNLRDLIAATDLVILLKLGFKSSIFQPVWPWNLMDDIEKEKGISSMLLEALCIIL